MQKTTFNRLLMHPSFKGTVSAINKLNIVIEESEQTEFDFNPYPFPPNGKLITNIEEFKNFMLDSKEGESMYKNGGIIICAYDESINKFASLEGTSFLTSHSLVVLDKDAYLPICFITFYFYTRSKKFVRKSSFIKFSEDAETSSKEDYVADRLKFILDNIPNNSIILIDGALIGGNMASYTIRLNEELLKRNIFPIFFVKNSMSNLVTNNIPQLKGKYNSDMHWSFKNLKNGERTCFFQYVDKYNKDNAKIFCYIKCFNVSPQRIEFHTKTYEKFKNKVKGTMNLIYYLMLAQGSAKNPQIRPVAIAEKFARDTIHLINLKNLMKESGIISTVNQERFGWS